MRNSKKQNFSRQTELNVFCICYRSTVFLVGQEISGQAEEKTGEITHSLGDYSLSGNLM